MKKVKVINAINPNQNSNYNFLSTPTVLDKLFKTFTTLTTTLCWSILS